MSYWAVVYTDVAAEPDVRREIEEHGIGAFLPYYRLGTWHGDQLRIRGKPLIPRYVFFHLQDGQAWASVNHAKGANRVLMVSDKPAQVSATEMANLVLAHASGAYNAIAPYRGSRGRFRKRRKRRPRPRPGRIATGIQVHKPQG